MCNFSGRDHLSGRNIDAEIRLWPQTPFCDSVAGLWVIRHRAQQYVKSYAGVAASIDSPHQTAHSSTVQRSTSAPHSKTTMPQYQLHVAVTLAVGLLASLTAWSFAGPKKPPTALPTSEDGLLPDPFDVTRPEDFVEGTPVDETRFWAKVERILPHNVFHSHFGGRRCVCGSSP